MKSFIGGMTLVIIALLGGMPTLNSPPNSATFVYLLGIYLILK